MMTHRITTDPSSGDKPVIQPPGSKTMKVDPGTGLQRYKTKHPHRRRAAARTRRAR
jgi:hypothetical protein